MLSWWLVKETDKLGETIHQAFHVATSGRPGPVLVDIPKDVQFASGTYVGPKQAKTSHYQPQTQGDEEAILAVVEMLEQAERPILYSGGGVINSGPEASKLLRELVAETDFPITSTLMGLGCYPASGDNWLGMLGMHGTYEANLAMHDCDFMLCIGARFDDRITGATDKFSPNSKKAHIDIDLEVKKWWSQINEWKEVKCLDYAQSTKAIKPQFALERLEALTKNHDRYICTEVGQHQMWAAQYLGFEDPNHWMTSGGLGTMGYGLPASVGVQVAHPDALVINVAGEASWLMNMQEMGTAVQYRLPIKQFILNNERLGMVRQWQELLHGERYSHSWSEALPDFVKLAEAFGGKGIRVDDPADLDDAIKEMIDFDGPVILDCLVEKHENCFPMIPSGKAHNEMILGDSSVEGAIENKGAVLV